MGGTDKVTVQLGGERLVDRTVAAVRAAGAQRVIVVGPEGVLGTEGIVGPGGIVGTEKLVGPALIRVREDPPLGGPAAAVAAALDAVRADHFMLLACDLESPAAVADALVHNALVQNAQPLSASGDDGQSTARAETSATPRLRSIVLVESKRESNSEGGPKAETTGDPRGDTKRGRPQWLAGVYASDAVRAAVRALGEAVHGAPVRRVLAHPDLHEIPVPASLTRDIDTAEDLRAARARHDDTRGANNG